MLITAWPALHQLQWPPCGVLLLLWAPGSVGVLFGTGWGSLLGTDAHRVQAVFSVPGYGPLGGHFL